MCQTYRHHQQLNPPVFTIPLLILADGRGVDKDGGWKGWKDLPDENGIGGRISLGRYIRGNGMRRIRVQPNMREWRVRRELQMVLAFLFTCDMYKSDSGLTAECRCFRPAMSCPQLNHRSEHCKVQKQEEGYPIRLNFRSATTPVRSGQGEYLPSYVFD